MNNFNIFYMLAITSLVLAGLTIPAKCQDANPVDNVCLGCICEASSGCNQTRTCSGDRCGLFGISWYYWADSGKLTINGESPQSFKSFENCVFDTDCATQTVQNYMKAFKEDCNGDGKIDCNDYAIIHRLGKYKCSGRIFGKYARVLNQCLLAYTLPESESSTTSTTTAAPQNKDSIQDFGYSAFIPPRRTTNPTTTAAAPQNEDSIQNFDYSVTIPPLSVFELVKAKENTTTFSPLKSENFPGDKRQEKVPEMTQIPKTDDSILNFGYSATIPPQRSTKPTTTAAPQNEDSIQNFDYSVTIPPLSVFELVKAKQTTTTAPPLKSDKLPADRSPDTSNTRQLQENVPQLKQIPQNEDSIQNFDYSVTIPPLSVFELVKAKETTPLTPFWLESNNPPADRRRIPEMKQIPKNEDSIQNFDYSATIPPLSVFELVKSKETTTTASPLENVLNQILGTEKDVKPKTKIQGEEATNSSRDVLFFPRSSDESLLSQEREVTSISNYYEGIVKRQDIYIEDLKNRIRIEKQENEILKEIAKNIKQMGRSDDADDIQLRIQQIERYQNEYLLILQTLQKTQTFYENRHQRRVKLLEAYQQRNLIDAERNEILKEIAKNIKKSGADMLAGKHIL